ncbi:MAG: hypothetical protein IMF11_16875 [Proteobacteria bacterium]|nr:hypothetical protein [Pseudomonadota bacterium]
MPNTNDEFCKKAERAFRELFDAAREKHELHFANALIPEMRGLQDAGWNTAAEAHRAFEEYLNFMQQEEYGRIRYRVALAFYCHISEASGFYEIPKNMLRIAGGQSYVLWPFRELVREHHVTGDQIAPNSNKILKDLMGHAKTLGFDDLAEVFRDAFDSDIRNGYAHADYVIWEDGLRLPRRNGGTAKLVQWDEFGAAFDRGIDFFKLLCQLVQEYKQSYSTPKTINASLKDEAETAWSIHYDPDTGAFEITGG